MGSSGNTLVRGDNYRASYWWTLFLSIILAYWIGSRPTENMTGLGYGDSYNYANSYLLTQANDDMTGFLEMFDSGDEWFFTVTTFACIRMGFSVSGFFMLIAFGYVMTAFWAIKKILPSAPYLGLCLVVSSLMFFTFSVNGLRNGLACHMILLALAFFMEDKWYIAAIIVFFAMGIHRSVALPVAGALAAWKIIKEPRYAIWVWLASIVLSINAGGWFMNFFSSLGFDDRMSLYTQGDLADHDEMFSKIGFRWDFLAYSAVPVFWTYFVNILHGRKDGWFNIISITYILCNAFWVLVIRAEYSNRFAYLSWFLYPFVIAYPLCYMKLFRNQNRIAGIALTSYYLFTWGMYTFVW